MTEDNVIINSGDKMLVVEHLYTVEDYFTFNIKAKSGEFSGASNFCLSKEMVFTIIETLSKMHKELKGYCEINDCDSDAYIALEMEELGHMSVSGQIGGSHEEHFMKFKYTTDQTILMKIIRFIKDLM